MNDSIKIYNNITKEASQLHSLLIELSNRLLTENQGTQDTIHFILHLKKLGMNMCTEKEEKILDFIDLFLSECRSEKAHIISPLILDPR